MRTEIMPARRLASLSIVLPAHNEVDNIEPLVAEASQVAPRLANRHEVIVVDDGSTDGTGELAEELAHDYSGVRVVHNCPNRGYGGALKAGFAAATSEWVFFTDGDRQFRLDELPRFVAASSQADLVIGYRLRRSDPLHRLLNAWLYKRFIQCLFGLRVRDIDCAYKLIHRSVLDAAALESEGALISAELLVKALRMGCRIVELGVHHYPRTAGRQSGANLGVILRMFREVRALHGKIRSFEARAAVEPADAGAEKVA